LKKLNTAKIKLNIPGSFLVLFLSEDLKSFTKMKTAILLIKKKCHSKSEVLSKSNRQTPDNMKNRKNRIKNLLSSSI